MVHVHRYTLGRDTYSKTSHGENVDKNHVEDEVSKGTNSIGDWSEEFSGYSSIETVKCDGDCHDHHDHG